MFGRKVVVCFKSLASQMLPKGSKEMEITGRDDIGTVRTVVHNLPVVAPLPRPFISMLPSDFNLSVPL
jgi:hypothetical protein